MSIKAPGFVDSGRVVHAHIIDSIDESRRRILAAEFEVDCVARTDLVINHFPRYAQALAGLGIVNPELDV